MGKVEGLLIKKRIEEAYGAFEVHESAFKMYLDDKTFIDLKKRVEQSNSLFQRQKSDAFRIVGAINRLIAQDEGDSAYKVFRQNDVFLSEYLNARTTVNQKRIARARADYAGMQNSRYAYSKTPGPGQTQPSTDGPYQA